MAMEKMPALYIGHGAPLLLDDPIWSSELAAITTKFEKPKAILIISAKLNPFRDLFHDSGPI